MPLFSQPAQVYAWETHDDDVRERKEINMWPPQINKYMGNPVKSTSVTVNYRA